MAAIFPLCLAIGAHLLQIRFVLLPADISSMSFTHEKRPLLLRDGFDVQRAIRMFGRLRASVAACAGITGIAQGFEHRVVPQGCKVDLAVVRPGPHAAGKQHRFFAKIPHRGPS